jgi:nucleoside-diphosphate-sugar epimerase
MTATTTCANPLVLVTGASGYLGRKILDRLLLTDGLRVVAPVRADSAEHLQQRADSLRSGRAGDRIDVVATDLSAAQPFAQLRARPISHVIHVAADTRFNISADEADAVNRDGSRKVFEFARGLPNLQRMVYFSSVYSCGLREGEIAEQLHDERPQFANHYERSKFEAEQLLHRDFDDLPWQIHRTATVLADNVDGAVSQINVFHNTAGLIYRGLISILPGLAATPIYLVDAEPVAANSARLCLNGGDNHRVYHLCYPAAACVTLQGMIDALIRAFKDDPQFVARRIRPPLLTDLDSFLGLADVLSRGFTGLLLRQSVDSVRPFASQLFSHKRFAVSLPDFANKQNDHHVQALIHNTLNHLMRNQWNTQPTRNVS